MASTVIKKVSTLLLESKNRKPSNLETSIRKLPQDKLNGLFSHDMSKHIPKISKFFRRLLAFIVGSGHDIFRDLFICFCLDPEPFNRCDTVYKQS